MTKRCIGGRAVMAVVAAFAMASVACSHNLATIHYSQPANAYLFDSDPTGTPHSTTSAGDGLFAFYCIGAIENNDTNAKDFTLDLTKLYATPDPGSAANNTSFSYLVQTVKTPFVVPAHTTSGKVGRVVIDVTGIDPQTKTPMLNLGYRSGKGESVVLVRDGGVNAPAVKFLDPASPVHPNNIPACP